MLYRVVTLTILGNVETTLYQDTNFEACKLAADQALFSHRTRRIVVIDEKSNHLYAV